MIASELPIYSDTFNLLSLIVDYVGAFPKLHKHTIGQRMTNVALDLFEYIQLANRSFKEKDKRIKYLEAFIIKFELLKVLIRLCGEKRIISIKQLSRLSVLIEKIGRQANAWKSK